MRDVILNNFWWKVTALVLAVLAWSGFQPREIGSYFRTTSSYRHMIMYPVTISKPATDTREFKVTPSEVDITLSGEEKVLRSLSASEVRAEVFMADYNGDTNTLPIQVAVPPRGGVKVERVSPETVQVEVIKQ
jgi:hypothetical protein